MGDFDKDYFHGRKGSNYSDYGKIDPIKKFRNVISFIRKRKVSGRFLDAGCAFGLLVNEMKSHFGEVHGFDISDYAIGKAKIVNSGVDLRVINLDDPLPYPDESFDCITALDILEHTESFDESLGKLTDKLKSGGYMIVSTPLDAWPRKLFGFLDKDKTHISVPREDDLRDMADRNNLRIIEEEKFAALPMHGRLPFVPASIELFMQKD
jgi:2-polyprenyl-3-methyl-5-hydroxy-6-metoxy-1,4-benzoquinol methylase